jgi:hypothetical protein
MALDLNLFQSNSNKIPFRGKLPKADRLIREGEHKSKACWYKSGLLNTLFCFTPLTCLEIGTHYGGTCEVFNYYFEKSKPDGFVITADIKTYKDLSYLTHVHPVLVYPHIVDIETWHHVDDKDLLSDAKEKSVDSQNANTHIIQEALQSKGHELFDFAFVDGDHTETSMMRDIAIAKALTTPPHIILLDDTKEGLHESKQVYEEKIKPNHNSYEFDDWPIFIGCSLIWDKE